VIRTARGSLRCPEPATDADHLDRLAGDEPENLGAKCRAHHRTKSGREGAQVTNAERAAMIGARVNPGLAAGRAHPGLRKE
jgi:hypothetical protein